MFDDRRRGWALAAFGMLMVSTDSAFIRSADFDAWTIAFVFGAASAIALSIVFAASSPIGPAVAFRLAPVPLLAVAMLSAGTQLAFTAAVNNTAVSNVVVIVAATPIVAASLAWLVLRERTEPRVAAAIAIAVAGIVIVVSGSIGEPTLDGDLLAAVAVVLFSGALVIWRRHPEIDRRLALAVASTIMAFVAAPFASLGDAPARVYVAAGLMGLIFNPIGRMSYTTAPKYAPVSEVVLFTPIETIAATVWAWAFFSERPPAGTVIGGTVVIAAVLYGTLGRRPRPPVRTRSGAREDRCDGVS
jgi:drug/metabolite transporter (DMT)-like permease